MASKKRIQFAFLFLLILLLVSWWLIRQNTAGTIRKELWDFAVEDTSLVTKIFMINRMENSVTLEKVKPGWWKVNGKYKARPDAIRNLLACMKDLDVRQPVSKSAMENVVKDLAATATKVEIYKGNQLHKLYYVGGDTQDGLGTYMLLADAETGKNSTMPFIMFIPGFNGFLSVRYFVEEDLWRDRSIFSYYPDEITSITLEYPPKPEAGFALSLSPENKISLTDSKGNNIADFDTLKAKRYITYFTNIQYEALRNNLRKSLKDSCMAKGPMHVLKLVDRKKNVTVVKTYPKPPESKEVVDPVTGKPLTEDLNRMFASVNEKEFVLIQYYVFGKLFQEISYFQKPPASATPDGVQK